MKRTTHLLLTLLAVGGSARTASAAVDCHSARRDPSMDAAEYLRQYSAACLPATRSLAPTPSVMEARTTIASADFSKVPTWSDTDIKTQFNATRDKVYLTGSNQPAVRRRISWLYPDDGCFARAEQVSDMAGDAGKAKPYKLFAFGNLRVQTNNHPSGQVLWGWHVVPVVKNTAGEPIVLDAALGPCVPMRYKEWLALMADNISSFDNVAGGWGITVADPNAYLPSSLVTGEPSHRTESLDDQQFRYLNYEWQRQIELGRDPNVVLGNSPPWGGVACKTLLVTKSVNIPPNSSGSVIASCPWGTLDVGGASMNFDLLLYKNARNGNGWESAAKNLGAQAASLSSQAICFVTSPGSNASISTVTGSKVTIAKGASNSTTATCNSGLLVSGGYLTTLGGTPSSAMKIYMDGRTANTGNSWRISANNTSSGSRDLTSYAYCLNNVNASVSQVQAALNGFDEGLAFASCPASQPVLLGGGFVLPKAASYKVTDEWNQGDGSFWVDFEPFPSGGDPNTMAYAQCMSKP